MVLAEKIIALRKRNGWSQEELAEQLSVSRQAVSKWESEASIPDLDKILKMSQLFGVSTDYLLKEEAEEPSLLLQTETDREAGVRLVTMEEASDYLHLRNKNAGWIGGAIAAIILSPVILLFLGAWAYAPGASFSEGTATAIGMTALLVLVALGVGILILKNMQLQKYEYLEEEAFQLQYGAESVIRRRQAEAAPFHRMGIATGVALCILSPIPLLIAGAVDVNNDLVMALTVDLLLILIAFAVFLFVVCSGVHDGCQILLQEGDYTKEKKKNNKRNGAIAIIYWCTVTVIFLAWYFSTGTGHAWKIWPCAGVLFAVVYALVDLYDKRLKRS